MATLPALRSLYDRVCKAEAPDRAVDRQIMALSYSWEQRHIGGTCWDDCHPDGRHLDWVWVDTGTDAWRTTDPDGYEFTASLDAITALIERELPEYTVQLFKRQSGGWIARLRSLNYELSAPHERDHANPWESPNGALALTAAFLAACIAKREAENAN